MKAQTDNPPAELTARQKAEGIDQVIRWSVAVFILSTLALMALAWNAYKTDQIAACLNTAGILYTILGSFFLILIGVVFVQGHVASSREIEAPKLELFELEKRR
jgi:cytosine/uracil/thiamine/allantoin permease